MCSWQAMQIIKCQHYRKCDFYTISQPILLCIIAGKLTISVRPSFTIPLTEIVNVKLILPRFPPPPLLPLHDHQCPADQPVSLVTQHRRTTPVNRFIKWPSLEGVHYMSISFSIFFVKEAQQNILSLSEHL